MLHEPVLRLVKAVSKCGEYPIRTAPLHALTLRIIAKLSVDITGPWLLIDLFVQQQCRVIWLGDLLNCMGLQPYRQLP